jgi:hypothetical protein
MGVVTRDPGQAIIQIVKSNVRDAFLPGMSGTFLRQVNSGMIMSGAVARRHIYELRPSAGSGLVVSVASGLITVPGSGLIVFPGDDATFTAPTSTSRIDLVAIDSAGLISVITGVEDVSPDVPTYPSDKLVVAEVTLNSGMVQVPGANVRDVRPFFILDSETSVGAHEILSVEHTDTDSSDIPIEGDALIYRTNQWVPETGVDIASDSANITAVNAVEQGSDPTQPATGHRLIYAKVDGWYDEDDSGNVSGPFSRGHIIENEGTSLTQRSNLNFTGPGVVASDSNGKSKVRVSRWEPLTDGETGMQFTDDWDVIMCEFTT